MKRLAIGYSAETLATKLHFDKSFGTYGEIDRALVGRSEVGNLKTSKISYWKKTNLEISSSNKYYLWRRLHRL